MNGSKFFFANWKMNVDEADAAALAREIKNGVLPDAVKVAVFPSFLSLPAVARELKKSAVAVGGQDCFWEDKGAYTGEISPAELAALGAKYVLVGHSERRRWLGETSAMVNGKVKAALKNGLTPVLCVGESADDRAAGRWPVTLGRELEEGLRGVELAGNEKIIIAYEPIWAIGTGKACEATDAVEAHKLILNYLHELFGSARKKENFSVIYGGSVDAKNIADYFKNEEIGGALVGGASQKRAPLSEMFKALADR
jgi:triosephosphate isomerase (TIM)